MSDNSEDTAKRIYQDLLDQIGKSYADDDFGYFRQVIHLPHKFRTEGKEIEITSESALEVSFGHFREYLAGMGVTDFVRTCDAAMFLDDDKIIGEHTSHIIRNGTWTREPYNVRSILRRIDGDWRVCSSENALPDNSWQAISFSRAQNQHTGCDQHPIQKTPNSGDET